MMKRNGKIGCKVKRETVNILDVEDDETVMRSGRCSVDRWMDAFSIAPAYRYAWGKSHGILGVGEP